MCGIVGYIGGNDSKDILLNGLEKLEYRGYDSAGIAVLNDSGMNIFKVKGRIAALREKVDTSVQGSIGIGHTRWATHGEPSEDNAHPHQSASAQFTLVHNGVIENYYEIRDEYLQNVELKSETDTEIVVQLIEQLYLNTNDVLEAFRQALTLLKGSYAIGLIDNQNPNLIYVAKNKSHYLLA